MTSNEPSNKKAKCIEEKSIEEIQSILECPVCLLTPRNPEKIHICSNHHIICENCKPKVQKCPTCRSENFQGKNPLLQKILSALPKICSFAEEGCQVEFEPKNGEELEKHLKICQYRQIDCVHNSCDLKVSFSNLQKHMEENHELDLIDNYYKIIVKPEDLTGQDDFSWLPSFIKFEDKIFYVQAFTEGDQMALQCYFHGTETESKKYFCEIFIENEALSRYKVDISGDVISVDIPKADRNMKNSTFTISMAMAKQLWNKDQENIIFKITINRDGN